MKPGIVGHVRKCAIVGKNQTDAVAESETIRTAGNGFYTEQVTAVTTANQENDARRTDTVHERLRILGELQTQRDGRE